MVGLAHSADLRSRLRYVSRAPCVAYSTDRVFPGGHPSTYKPRSMVRNFGDLTGALLIRFSSLVPVSSGKTLCQRSLLWGAKNKKRRNRSAPSFLGAFHMTLGRYRCRNRLPEMRNRNEHYTTSHTTLWLSQNNLHHLAIVQSTRMSRRSELQQTTSSQCVGLLCSESGPTQISVEKPRLAQFVKESAGA